MDPRRIVCTYVDMLLVLFVLLSCVQRAPARPVHDHNECIIDVMQAAGQGVVQMTKDSCVYVLEDIRNRGTVGFQVKACQSFRVILSERIHPLDHGKRILIGGEGNTVTCFLNDHDDRCEHQHDGVRKGFIYNGPVLNCNHYKSFWLTFYDHAITLGWGRYPGYHNWLIYDEHHHGHTNYFSGKSGVGTRASITMNPTLILTGTPHPASTLVRTTSRPPISGPTSSHTSKTPTSVNPSTVVNSSQQSGISPTSGLVSSSPGQTFASALNSSKTTNLNSQSTGTTTPPQTTTLSTTMAKSTLAPVDGSWGPWTNLFPCSASCDGGTVLRARLCNSPAPSNGGRVCLGSNRERTQCNTQQCGAAVSMTTTTTTTTTAQRTTLMAIDGQWGAWKPLFSCSVTCGGGTMVRVRLCNAPAPANGGKDCVGSNHEPTQCNSQPCPPPTTTTTTTPPPPTTPSTTTPSSTTTTTPSTTTPSTTTTTTLPSTTTAGVQCKDLTPDCANPDALVNICPNDRFKNYCQKSCGLCH